MTVGRYTLGAQLGAGAQGTVYEATARLPGGLVRRVALKRLDASGDELLREARIGGLLRHPHLVDVYEVGEDEGGWYCAMELCEGGSLADRPPLPPRAVVDVGLQVCEALAYAHEELALVHLDLKPANLLIRGGVVKVGDLGIAQARGFAEDGRIRGTPRFMAPEQRRGLAVDARTDIWALGLVLRELATGAPLDTTTQDVGDAPPVPDRAAWEWLAPVFDRCTEPDARDRFPSMRALASALRALPVHGPSLVEVFGPPPTPVPADRTGNLGASEGALHGRETLLRALDEWLSGAAPVVLKGPAGIGKTRLVSEAGRRVRAATGRPVWRIDLSGATTRADLVGRVAHALDVPLRGAPAGHLRQLADAITGRGAPLVVLDSVEQLSRALLAEWAEGVRLVATTRVALDLPEAHVLEVPPLDAPAAAQLLAARAAERGVTLGDDPAVAELVARLDGVPLALELAAGRLGVLSPAELVSRLGLSFLRSGSASRQATLRGVLDSCWELLGDRERAALAQLAVFRGGFGPDDASAVVAGSGALDALQALADHSLVTVRAGRFDLLAPVRAYAEERLEARGDARATEARHAAWFAQSGADDLANLTAAVARAAAAGAGEVAARAALNAAAVFTVRGPMDAGIDLLTRALSVAPPALRPALLVERAAMAIDAGRLEDAERDLTEADDAPDVAVRVALERGDLHLARAALSAAGEQYARALAICDEARVPPGRARLCLGAVQLQSGDLDRAEETLRQAVTELRRVGDRRSEASALGNLGIVLRLKGRPDDARPLYEEALAIGEQLGARTSTASDHANLAILDALAGHLEAACDHLHTAIDTFAACGMRASEAQQLGNLGEVYLLLGRPADARRCGEAALAVHRRLGNPRLQGACHLLLGAADALDGASNDARAHYTAALACQVTAGVGSAAAAARLELARLSLREGEPRHALEALERALSEATGQASLIALLRAARGEARATLGLEGARDDLDAAAAALRHSPTLWVAARCAAARAFGDRGAQAEAEAVDVRPGSLAWHDLARTRATLADRSPP